MSAAQKATEYLLELAGGVSKRSRSWPPRRGTPPRATDYEGRRILWGWSELSRVPAVPLAARSTVSTPTAPQVARDLDGAVTDDVPDRGCDLLSPRARQPVTWMSP